MMPITQKSLSDFSDVLKSSLAMTSSSTNLINNGIINGIANFSIPMMIVPMICSRYGFTNFKYLRMLPNIVPPYGAWPFFNTKQKPVETNQQAELCLSWMLSTISQIPLIINVNKIRRKWTFPLSDPALKFFNIVFQDLINHIRILHFLSVALIFIFIK
jgi:hypothetical protein